ncbi:MAG: hypothetical protein LCI00_25555 [Chloroflexi bacterium]|nr:hypothetical protein [Chloroflexota bacterium]MCC6895407.1 hypothetical protein [Anaerolineae bacterium]
MTNYLHDINRAQQRMTELMQEAENDRRLPAEPGLGDSLMNAVGTWMINTGERLTQAKNDKKFNFIETANG